MKDVFHLCSLVLSESERDSPHSVTNQNEGMGSDASLKLGTLLRDPFSSLVHHRVG
jgi:hypothetical protein